MTENIRRMCIYLNEGDRQGGKPLWQVVIEFLRAEGCSGATVFRGVSGFGGHNHIHTSNLADLSPNLPLMIDLIDNAEKLDSILPRLDELVTEGLITLQDVQIYKYSYRRENINNPHPWTVGDAMTPGNHLVTAQPQTSLYDAIKMLLNKSFRALPVVDVNNKVVGIVTDGDIFTKGGAPFRLDHLQALAGDPALLTQTLDTFKANAKTVAEIMSNSVVTLSRNESLVDAAKLMNTWHLKRLPVVDGEGKLVGLLSRFDLLQASLKQPRITGDDNVAPVPQLKISADTLVDEIVTGDFPRILEDATLSEALSRLMAARQHRAVVVNQQGKAVGVITEGDMITRVGQQTRTGILQGLRRKLGLSSEEFAMNLTTNKVSNIVQGRLISIPGGARLSQAVELMAQEKVKILPVLDEAGRPLGVLTRRIILQALLHAAEQ